MSIRFLKNLHTDYSYMLKQKASIGNKKLISAWGNTDNVITSGQYFERKFLPNGNIKTRIVTIYDNKSKAIGLETKVMTHKGDIIYKSAGIVKDNSKKLMKKIKLLKKKIANGLGTQRDKKSLEQMKHATELNTKIYENGDNVVFARNIMYKSSSLDNPKTLIGKSFGLFKN